MESISCVRRVKGSSHIACSLTNRAPLDSGIKSRRLFKNCFLFLKKKKWDYNSHLKFAKLWFRIQLRPSVSSTWAEILNRYFPVVSHKGWWIRKGPSKGMKHMWKTLPKEHGSEDGGWACSQGVMTSGPVAGARTPVFPVNPYNKPLSGFHHTEADAEHPDLPRDMHIWEGNWTVFPAHATHCVTWPWTGKRPRILCNALN